MILHIAGLDSIFIDMAYEIFEEVYPKQNKFIRISSENNLKYIKKAEVELIKPDEIGLVVKNLFNYKVVIIHYLDYFSAKLVNLSDKNVNFHWMAWGGDYYELMNIYDFLEPKTKRVFDKIDTKAFLINPYAYKKYKEFEDNAKREKLSAIKKFKSCTFVFKEEYEFFIEKFPEFRNLIYIPWNYGTLEEHIYPKNLDECKEKLDYILVGHGASFESNHLDIFEILIRNHNLNYEKLICPLSYGFMPYRDFILKQGYKLFGEKFYPLTEFLSLHNYIDLISKCKYAIFNHKKQEALGNIAITMYSGSVVFMNSNSPIYKFLKNRGAIVFDINVLKNGNSFTLTNKEIEINKNIIKNIWGKEMIFQKTVNLIKTLKR